MYVVANIPHPPGETSLMNDCKHPGKLLTERESVLQGYESALDVPFTGTGCELTGDTVTDFFDNEETETNRSVIPTTFQPENFSLKSMISHHLAKTTLSTNTMIDLD
jgi:hypothetical protein